MNAITDALGITDMDMPATPHKIWQIIAEKEGK
jgi:CO/xanthine dehydrogenase Mo-binding subunit